MLRPTVTRHATTTNEAQQPAQWAHVNSSLCAQCTATTIKDGARSKNLAAEIHHSIIPSFIPHGGVVRTSTNVRGSETDVTRVQWASGQPADASAYAVTSSGWTWNDVMAAILNERLCQSMHIYLTNVVAKFHPDLIWNDRALGFFEDGRPTRTITTIRWVAIRYQFLTKIR